MNKNNFFLTVFLFAPGALLQAMMISRGQSATKKCMQQVSLSSRYLSLRAPNHNTAENKLFSKYKQPLKKQAGLEKDPFSNWRKKVNENLDFKNPIAQIVCGPIAGTTQGLLAGALAGTTLGGLGWLASYTQFCLDWSGKKPSIEDTKIPFRYGFYPGAFMGGLLASYTSCGSLGMASYLAFAGSIVVSGMYDK